MSNNEKQQVVGNVRGPVEVLDYSKEERQINEAANAGNCPCSAIVCSNKCAFPGTNGVDAAVSTSQATASAGG